MGIIGLIIGAVFAVASIAQYHVELDTAANQIGTIVGNMRSLYSGQNAINAPKIDFGTLTLVQQGVFPAEMLNPALPKSGIPAAGTVANHTWSQNTPNGSVQIQVNDPTPGQFAVRFLQVPSDVCADLLVRNSQPGPETGLMQLKVNNTAVGIANDTSKPLPMTPLSAAAACPTGETYTIDWYYTLGS
jgi:hypothetical protein